MQNDNIICNECLTENEPHYEYCKNCGAPLRANAKQKTDFTPQYPENQPMPNGYYVNYGNNYGYFMPKEMYEIGGIPRDEIESFVGKKAKAILPRFERMELKNSKVSWCWPVAILSLFFGPFGAACWFFYRKLYKLGIIFLSISILLLAIETPVSYSNQLITEKYTEQFDQMISSDEMLDETELQAILENMYGEILNEKTVIISLLEFVVEIALLIFTGLTAWGYYKKYVIDSINRYRYSNVDPRYYRMGLVSLGGTSGGMAVLAVAVYLIARIVISTVYSLVIAV